MSIQGNVNQLIAQFGTLGGLYAMSPGVAEQRAQKQELKTTQKQLKQTQAASEKLMETDAYGNPPSTELGETEYKKQARTFARGAATESEAYISLAEKEAELAEKEFNLNPTYETAKARHIAAEEAKEARNLHETEDVIYQRIMSRYSPAQVNAEMAQKGTQKIEQKAAFQRTKELVKQREPQQYNKLKLQNELLRRKLQEKEVKE